MAYQPKSYRKFVATAATATLVASAIAPVAGAASNFSDVAPKYKDAVDYLVNNNITQGTTPTTFGTHDNIKRGDLAIWLAKALKLDTASAPASGFEDTAGTRYDAAVSVLKAKGIVSGKSETSYAPSAYVTRGEMAIMLSRAYELSTDEKAPFTDMGAYAPYINGLYAYDITTGKTPETFGTALNITRGDLAIFLKRAAEVVKTPSVVSASALNAKQIVVNFNTALNADANVTGDASEANLYTLDGAAASSAVLSADKKSVTLTFANDVEGSDQVLVVNPVATNAKDANGAWVKTEKFSQVFSYTDKVAPVVSSTSYANGKITLTFSEELSQLPTVVRVNGTPVTAIAFATGSKTKVEVTTSLAAGSTASLFVAGAKDDANTPNEMALYNGTVVAPGADTEKPRVTSTTVTGQNTATVTLSEAVAESTINATLQRGATQHAVTLVKDTTDTTGKTYNLTVDLNGATAGDGIFPANSTSETFTLYIAANAMTDAAGLKNEFYSTGVTFVKDTTAPVLASNQVGTDNKKLEFTFSEALTVVGSDSNIIITNGEGVRIAAIDAETALKSGDAKTYQVDTKSGDVALDAGTYTVSIPAGFFTDAYGNASAAVSGTFTVGTASSNDTVKPTATVTNSGKNQFTIAYSEEVTSTALNLANYKLDGQSLPAGTDIYFTSSAKNQVVITLPAGSINIGDQTTGAAAILTVSGVADKAGNVINTSNHSVTVKDNTAATVSNVQVIGSDVYVTFTENVTFANGTDADNAFDVTVNGSAVTAGYLQSVAGNSKQVKFTLDNAPAATPVVKVEANQTVLTDVNGTPVK